MQIHNFIAESAADAVAQIRAQLGPKALVLNVRPLPADGLSRLWQKPRIEVLACIPESSSPDFEAALSDPVAAQRQEMLQIRQRAECESGGVSPGSAPKTAAVLPISPDHVQPVAEAAKAPQLGNGAWRVGAFLETSGLMPIHAARIVEDLRAAHGDPAPVAFARELELAAAWLRRLWHRTAPTAQVHSGAHVLIGPPGVGKTVCLCKWLAHSILAEGRKPVVWRLDGRTANTAETLSVYGEILGIPVERTMPSHFEADDQNLLLIDLPGVASHDPVAVGQLAQQIKQLPHPQVHLVLNAAYEGSLLQSQLRAFSVLPVTDLIFTHLDEETRWGKLWNIVIGTNYCIRFVSAGQNIPGDWAEATPEQILTRQFPRK